MLLTFSCISTVFQKVVASLGVSSNLQVQLLLIVTYP